MHQAEKRRQQHSRGGLWNKGIRERREKTGQCLNIEHMSVSPLPTKIEATTVDHRTYDHLEQTKRERQREILSWLPVLRPRVCCYAASFLRFPVVRLVPTSFLPSFSPFFFSFSYFTSVCSREERSFSIHLFLNGSRFVRGIYRVLRGNKVTGERQVFFNRLAVFLIERTSGSSESAMSYTSLRRNQSPRVSDWENCQRLNASFLC